jgi:hypothetical protein
MGNEMKSESQNRTDAIVRSLPTSYDSGYEHSPEHWIELQQLVHEAEGAPPAFAMSPSPPALRTAST